MMQSLDWQNQSSNLVLLKDEIHLWRANLNLSSQQIEQLATTLSEDEKQRANRFKFPQHKQRFIAARAILRRILGIYLQTSENKIGFTYNPQGKPQLTSSFSDYDLQFNISHSEDLALYSFNYQQKIGIDLEYIRDNVDFQAIAKRFFCEQEFNLINSYTTEQQKQIFYRLWTAKEAYLKAIGEGIGGGLETLEIKIDPEEDIYLHSIRNEKQVGNNWSLYNFIPKTNFIGTIALSGKKKKLIPIKYNS